MPTNRICKFKARGHPNILATHRTTLEITKDTELTEKGDCIIAVAADFSLQRIKDIISSCSDNGKVKLTVEAAGIKEEITAAVNKAFSSGHEIVFRKGSFLSERTLGIHADKAAAELGRRLADKLKDANTAVSVTIEAA